MLGNAVELWKMASKATNVGQSVCDIFNINVGGSWVNEIKLFAGKRLYITHNRIFSIFCSCTCGDFWLYESLAGWRYLKELRFTNNPVAGVIKAEQLRFKVTDEGFNCVAVEFLDQQITELIGNSFFLRFKLDNAQNKTWFIVCQ